MPVEYEYVEGVSGLKYVLENEPEQWTMAFSNNDVWCHSSSWMRVVKITIPEMSLLRFRRQVSSTLEL